MTGPGFLELNMPGIGFLELDLASLAAAFASLVGLATIRGARHATWLWIRSLTPMHDSRGL